MKYTVKNKEAYNLTELTIRPKYMTDGCGKKITSKFKFDILHNNKVIAKDLIARDSLYIYLMEWLEQDKAE